MQGNMMKNEKKSPTPLLWWRDRFGIRAPVGYALRPYLKKNWVRFHSLPKSKRYPATAEEYEEVFNRHQAVTDFLFQEGEEVFIYKSVGHYPAAPENKPYRLADIELLSDDIPFYGYPEQLPLDDEEALSVWGASISWQPMAFRAIIRQVADGDEHNVCFVSPATGNIFYPYDGGMDIFLFNSTLPPIKRRFADWLPSHPLGL